MERYFVKTAQELEKYDCYFDVTRVNKIANTLAKKIIAPSTQIKSKGKKFSEILSLSWKMSKNDMQDFDKVYAMFKKIFNLYHAWSVNAQKAQDPTYYNKGLKVFDNSLDKFVEKLIVPEEKGGPGWSRKNVYEFMYEASKGSNYWNEGNSQGVNWSNVTRGLHH